MQTKFWEVLFIKPVIFHFSDVLIEGFHCILLVQEIPEEVDSVYSSCPVCKLVNEHFGHCHFRSRKSELEKDF